MSYKRKLKIAIDLYKETLEYTPQELNEDLRAELDALNDFINEEMPDKSENEQEINAFAILDAAIDTCLPYLKKQMMIGMSLNGNKASKEEAIRKLIDDFEHNNRNDKISEMNINDWCVQNGYFEFEEESKE
jgi:hypothetical protein